MIQLTPNEPPPPDDEKPATEVSSTAGTVAKAAMGFVAAPVIFGLTATFNSPVPPFLFLGSAFVMLFFRGWRPFGLGVLLFTGVALILLLAICGGSSF